MSKIIDLIVDNFPPVSGLSIPLGTPISVTFGTLMNTSGVADVFFVEGPDTDQFIGPGLIEQQYPQNISQGALNDFLKSPGYTGIVQGVYTTFTVSGLLSDNITPYVGTKFIFTPEHPLAASTTYTVYITQTTDVSGNVVSGYVDWPFETGTGSIQQLPNTISTSVLAEAFRSPGLSPASANILGVVSTTPEDHSVQNDTNTQNITITFDKPIDSSTITTDMINIQTVPLSSHPNINVNAQGQIAFNYTVSGNTLVIAI